MLYSLMTPTSTFLVAAAENAQNATGLSLPPLIAEEEEELEHGDDRAAATEERAGGDASPAPPPPAFSEDADGNSVVAVPIRTAASMPVKERESDLSAVENGAASPHHVGTENGVMDEPALVCGGL